MMVTCFWHQNARQTQWSTTIEYNCEYRSQFNATTTAFMAFAWFTLTNALRSQGAKVKLYNTAELADEFKWLNTDDIELGSFGLLSF